MKNIFIKILLIFTFILNFALLPSNAESLGISSVTFDNSGAFMSINSPDNMDYQINTPQIMNVEEDNEVYFELQPARLNNGNKNYLINTDEINEIGISQISTTPDIVRITIKYKQGYNPQNITINRLNNTLFVQFKKTQMTNYYFQEVYKESGTIPVYENINIQQKLSSQKNVLGEINSAFTQDKNTAPNDFILSTKNLYLKTKYYINSVTLKGNTPILNGNGTYTLIRPIYLTNPERVAFDIKNTVVNQMLRNKDIPLGEDILKIGQFDHNTARVVITTKNSETYVPVIFGDIQKIAFLNTKNTSPLNLYSTTSNMTAVALEKGDDTNHSIKFAFSKPLIFGLKRTSDKIEILLYNVNNYFSGAIESEVRATAFEKMQTSDIKNGGVKFAIPIKNDDKCDIYLGANGKTLRIKLHTAEKYTPANDTQTSEPEIIVPAVVKKHTAGKKYVVIDAGHGGTDYGAIRNGINEKDITLDISKRVQAGLEKKGYNVAMTRTDDTYVSLQDRVEFSEIFNPDIFVSIHVNSSNSESPSGIETHYYKDNSLKLAKHIHASMLNNINSKDRGLFKSKFYVINHTTAPAILVEIGFISNPNERAQLVTESRKNATAKAIIEGIDGYFKK
ncbi:N-acetylmuramoyl-L-alanine amidase [bacterium]|nr:N-acetylmuramoyl-L-alanine amidase [bacterium]